MRRAKSKWEDAKNFGNEVVNFCQQKMYSAINFLTQNENIQADFFHLTKKIEA